MSTDVSGPDAVFRRDRIVILTGLAAVVFVAWAYLFYVAGRMGSAGEMGAMDMVPEMAMPDMHRWGVVEFLLLLVMWTVMMVAMMVPSASPLILIFARTKRQKGGRRVVGSAGILLLGYLLVWAGFSVLAALAQRGLHTAALLSPMMVSASPVLGGVLLMAAGIFQFTRLKHACLVRCRSPLSFLMSDWREGRWGTFVMGTKHGAYCVGCCWLLMALLFVAGVMNLLWVAVIAGLVLVEKVAPKGDHVGRIAGAALLVAGITLIVT
jgi:predicted metal-binding membrane protein